MKKTISMALVIAFLISALAGCAGNGAAGRQTKAPRRADAKPRTVKRLPTADGSVFSPTMKPALCNFS